MKRVSLREIRAEGVSHNPAIEKKVLFRLGEVPHLTQMAQSRFAPGQIATGHAHADMAEVFFVESGAGEIRIDGVGYGLEPGVCVAVEVGERHEIECGPDSELVLTYFGIRVEPAVPGALARS